MTTSSPIRVLLVEDNDLTRLGIATLIKTQKDLLIVGIAEDGAQAVELCRTTVADVLLTDLRMPGLDGFATIAQAKKIRPALRVLVLTNLDGTQDVQRAIQAGAIGYVTKGMRGTEVLTAIRTVARNEHFLPPAIARRLAEVVAQPALTPREQQCLELVAAGLSNQEVGVELGLSKRTVESYMSNILEKMDAKSRVDAVSRAVEQGLIRRKIPE